jgi:hypothetical protein
MNRDLLKIIESETNEGKVRRLLHSHRPERLDAARHGSVDVGCAPTER